MINLEINGELYKLPQAETIIQSCSRIGVDIPRFCYHEKLSVAGNCRMCLVEISFPKSMKPVASCALISSEGMKVLTNTALIRKARETVLEFMLINHPLDCPICDQGGECDLQDQTFIYGSDRGRFYEAKRSVNDKDSGPIIKTIMTRCIQCTRCVRFATEVAGANTLGVLGRGSNMEIGSFLNNMLVESEVSGNIIDLCPVGALTSKPYSFTNRPWELRTIESVDIIDSFCSSIRIDVRGSDIMRILPLVNAFNNDEWISDKTRFFYDGLKRQRLVFPSVLMEGSLVVVSWEKVFEIFASFLSFFSRQVYCEDFKMKNFYAVNRISFDIHGFIGTLVDLESILSMKDFLNGLSSSNFKSDFFCSQLFSDNRQNFLCKISLNELNKLDFCLIFGFNLRLELPLLNIVLKKLSLNDNLLVLMFGQPVSLGYFSYHLLNSSFDLLKFFEGRNIFCSRLVNSLNPAILISSNSLKTLENSYFYTSFFSLIKYFRTGLVNNPILNFVNLSASNIGLFEFGFFANRSNKKIKTNSLLYFLGSDKVVYEDVIFSNGDFFSVFQGHHSNEHVSMCDLIFPVPSFVEKTSSYYNFRGIFKKTKRAVIPLDCTKDDWDVLGKFLQYFSKLSSDRKSKDILSRAISLNMNTLLRRFSQITPSFKTDDTFFLLELPSFFFNVFFYNSLFLSSGFNHYMTDSITKSSSILSSCMQNFSLNHKSNFV